MKTQRNPLAAYQDKSEKFYAYRSAGRACAVAYKSDGTTIPLRSVPADQVEFIGGLWRVQDQKSYNIKRVRDRDLIIGNQLPHNERTFFEYYQASQLTYNCYGILPPQFDLVVAKYATDKGIYYSYGKNIADARAFLGIRLYDEYMDLIHSVACKNTMQHGEK